MGFVKYASEIDFIRCVNLIDAERRLNGLPHDRQQFQIANTLIGEPRQATSAKYLLSVTQPKKAVTRGILSGALCRHANTTLVDSATSVFCATSTDDISVSGHKETASIHSSINAGFPNPGAP